MIKLKSRIPNDMATEILAEAARLHYAQENINYSFAHLERARLEAQIPTHIVWKAIKNVEEKRLRSRKQIKKRIFIGILLLVSAIAMFRIFIFVAPSNKKKLHINAQSLGARVKTLTVQTDIVKDSEEFIATLRSRKSAIIKPPSEGQITRIFVNAGDTVALGETIMELVSTKQQKHSQRLKILAPHAGTVDNILVTEGELVDTSSQLTAIVQNQPLEVNIFVPTERANQLHKGMSIELIDIQSQQSLGITKVFFISPSVDNNLQAVLVKSLFDNSKGELRTGQLIRARIIWNQRPGIEIPVDAVSKIRDMDFVFVAQKQQVQGTFQFVASQKLVKLGNIDGKNYHVLEGLQPGDRIIVSGVQSLTNGVPIIPIQNNCALYWNTVKVGADCQQTMPIFK